MVIKRHQEEQPRRESASFGASAMDDIGQPEQQEAKNRPRGKPFPPGTSGNASGQRIINERVAAYFEQMAGDFPNMSNVERSMLTKACRLLVRSDGTRNADGSARLACAAGQLLRTLRIMRRAPLRRERTPPPVGSKTMPMRDQLATETADAE